MQLNLLNLKLKIFNSLQKFKICVISNYFLLIFRLIFNNKRYRRVMMAKINKILITLFFFFLAGVCEIGGGYLVWLWLREDMSWIIGALGGFVLFFYAIVPTFQPSHFHRIYAAYGGIFIIMSVLWGWLFEGIAPDSYDIIGTIIAIIGVIIIYYMPRKDEEKTIWQSETVNPVLAGPLFFVAALLEIGGGYLVWLVDKRKENNCISLTRCDYSVCLWYNTYTSASPFWESICCIWWNIHYFFNSMG